VLTDFAELICSLKRRGKSTARRPSPVARGGAVGGIEAEEGPEGRAAGGPQPRVGRRARGSRKQRKILGTEAGAQHGDKSYRNR